LGPNPPGSAKPGGKGPTTEVFRRVGYWLYSTAPVQFIKQAMVEERNDSVTVLFPTDKSIWILGVSYRLKKNAKNVILPAAIEADSTHLQMDSSLFLSHHHQKRSTSPSRAHPPRSKPDAAASQRRTEEVGNRRRANTSGAMLNKKHLQGISQLQNYPGLPPIPDAGGGHAAGTAAATTAAAAAALSAKHGMRGLASIPSQDLLRPKLAGPTPISPMPFPDEPAIPIESGRLGHNTDVGPDLDSCSISSGVRQTILAQQPHLLAEERPKSSRMNRLRSWVARTANPMRRNVPAPAAARSRPTSPESQLTAGVLLQPPPSRKSSEAPRSSVMALGLKGAARSSSSTSVGSGSEPRSLGLALPGAASRLRRKSRETLTTLSSSHTAADGQRRSWFDMDVGSHGSLPPVPSIPESASIPATANPSNAAAAAPGSGLPAHGALLPPWESPAASIMMFQREWKLPSFQQLVSVQSATAWAKDCGWTVTLSSETFFMAYIFFNLPREPVAAQGPSVGEKAAGDRLLLRMRLGMEDFEGTAAAGDAWRDAIT
ncbi:hypothetical protein GGH92_008148, partial [Coemansia sp. RSA 2673]